MNFKKPNSIIIAGTGSYVPEKTVSNDDLAKFLDTSDEWIFERSGIRRRHIAADGEAASDMEIGRAHVRTPSKTRESPPPT